MKKNIFVLLIASFVLSSCLKNRTDNYVNAQNNPPLKTPPGITEPGFKDSYPIPKKSSSAIAPAPDLTPPGYEKDLETAEKETKSS